MILLDFGVWIVAISGLSFAQTHDAYPGRKRQTRENDFGKFIKMFVSVLNKSIKFGLKDCTWYRESLDFKHLGLAYYSSGRDKNCEEIVRKRKQIHIETWFRNFCVIWAIIYHSDSVYQSFKPCEKTPSFLCALWQAWAACTFSFRQEPRFGVYGHIAFSTFNKRKTAVMIAQSWGWPSLCMLWYKGPMSTKKSKSFDGRRMKFTANCEWYSSQCNNNLLWYSKAEWNKFLTRYISI